MAELTRPTRRLLAAGGIAAALFGLCGCTDQTKVYEGELTELLALLPGRYDNTAQAELEARNGVRPAHDAVELTIIHVYTPRLGHHVYYAQETAADDPRRVLSQKMYSFQVDEKRGVVETLYQFVEPLRWRDGQQNKDLLPASSATTCCPRAVSCSGNTRRRVSSPPTTRRSVRTPLVALPPRRPNSPWAR